MHNTIPYHPLTGAQAVPEQQSAPPSQLLPADILGKMLCGIEYTFGQLRPAVLAMLSPGFLSPSSLQGMGNQNVFDLE